jgi:hypothetical protein
MRILLAPHRAGPRSGRRAWGGLPINELEQRLHVCAAVTGQRVGERWIESGAHELPPAPRNRADHLRANRI